MSMYNTAPFDVAEMTDSINKLPLMPMRLTKLFTQKSVRTTTVALDIKKGRITLVEDQDRSAPAQSLAGKGDKRSLKTIETAHLPQSDNIRPEDVQDVRAFGSNEPLPMVTAVNDKLAIIKNNIAMTKEIHRLGAVKGVVMDADGETEILDLFDLFGATKVAQTLTFPTTLKVNEDPILAGVMKAKRSVEAGMGGVPYQRIEAIVGANFYDKLTGNQLVRDAYRLWAANLASFGDNDYRKRGFTYGGVTWYEASETVGGLTLVDSDKAHVYPVGAGIFTEYMAPANWMSTVNTYGKPYYAQMQTLDNDRGYYVEGQANPLNICNFPEALVEITAA